MVAKVLHGIVEAYLQKHLQATAATAAAGEQQPGLVTSRVARARALLNSIEKKEKEFMMIISSLENVRVTKAPMQRAFQAGRATAATANNSAATVSISPPRTPCVIKAVTPQAAHRKVVQEVPLAAAGSKDFDYWGSLPEEREDDGNLVPLNMTSRPLLRFDDSEEAWSCISTEAAWLSEVCEPAIKSSSAAGMVVAAAAAGLKKQSATQPVIVPWIPAGVAAYKRRPAARRNNKASAPVAPQRRTCVPNRSTDKKPFALRHAITPRVPDSSSAARRPAVPSVAALLPSAEMQMTSAAASTKPAVNPLIDQFPDFLADVSSWDDLFASDPVLAAAVHASVGVDDSTPELVPSSSFVGISLADDTEASDAWMAVDIDLELEALMPGDEEGLYGGVEGKVISGSNELWSLVAMEAEALSMAMRLESAPVSLVVNTCCWC